jgi:rod shape-determining protein MreC
MARDHNFFDKGVIFISAPVQWAVVSTLDSVTSLWHRYVSLFNLQEENDRLKAENAQLSAEVAAREEESHENERLRQMVGLRERAPAVKMLFAEVIGTSPSPLFRSIRIDRGSRDGIELGAAIVSHEGVVGRVAKLSENYADVILLVDSNSSTDVLVQRTRARARIRGLGGDDGLGIEVQYLARTADVQPGDALITSGLSQAFPKGLLVGRVMSVEKRAFGLYQRAQVLPSVDFSRLEGVMVIVAGYPKDATFEATDVDEVGPVGPVIDAPANPSPSLPDAVAPAAPEPAAPEPPRGLPGGSPEE